MRKRKEHVRHTPVSLDMLTKMFAGNTQINVSTAFYREHIEPRVNKIVSELVTSGKLNLDNLSSIQFEKKEIESENVLEASEVLDSVETKQLQPASDDVE